MKQILDWVFSILLAVVIATLIHIFIFIPTRVSGQSMYPTLTDGQFLVVSKIDHVFRKAPNYNDIVIIDSRVNRSRSWKDDIMEPIMNYKVLVTRKADDHNVWVKRVIGKAGDVLEFKNGFVYRNGEKLDEPYINEPMNYKIPAAITVPEGTVWVMGDNRNNSTDSRYIGFVPVDHVLGVVKVQL